MSQIMRSSAAMLEESTKKRMAALGEAAALLSTAEELDEFMTVEDMEKPAYHALKERLDAFTQRSEVMFTYYMRLDRGTDMMRFVVDNVLDPADEPDGLDSPPVAREKGPDLALAGQHYVVDLGSYSDGWDGLLTAWAPVPRADGSPSDLVAGVDMQDVHLKAVNSQAHVLSALLVGCMLAVLAICMLCLRLYQREARQAASASEAKSSFLSRMSHEIRTPMNAIVGLCGMATRAEDMDAIKGFLANIHISSQHLRNIVDDVLDISKIESGKLVLEYTPVSPRQELEQVERIIRPQADAKKLSFTCRLAPELPPAILCDKVHVRQVVINLLSNAVKFTPEGGSVTLDVALLDQRDGKCNLEWRVKDTGIGISEAGRKKIFQAFEQDDISTTRKYGGTGLGLAISKQLVEMMGGHIRLESELGRGSEFIFNIWSEVGRPEDLPTDQSGEEAPRLHVQGKRILLVEDTEINQLIAGDLLKSHGARVEIAENGQVALNAYLANPEKYDVIFMDIQMPVMDGYEATRRIRASGLPNAGRVPIIAMTANVFKEDVDRARAAGMDGHIGKPLDLRLIQETLSQVLGGGPSARV